MIGITFLFIVLFGACISIEEKKNPIGTTEILFEANHVSFDFTERPEEENKYENEGYTGVLLAGAKFLGDKLFISMPRWSDTVPATFATLDLQSKKATPFPSWEENDYKDETRDPTTTLFSVLGFEFDENGNIFVLDQGKVNDQVAKEGSIKVIKYSKEGKLIDTYPIPTNIASTDNSFVNDLVYDPVKQFLYISDCGKPISENGVDPRDQEYKGQIISLDLKTKKYRAYLTATEYTNPEKDYVFHIRENTYRTYTGVDGIALSPDGKYLYFCPLTSKKLYRIETKYLRENHKTNELTDKVELVIERPSAADGIMFDGSGNLFVTGIESYSVYIYENSLDRNDFSNIEVRYLPLVTNTTTLGWCDTMGFTDDGSITVVSNNLDLFDSGLMFTSERRNEINFRITRINAGAMPYWENIMNSNNENNNDSSGLSTGAVIGIAIGCFIVGLIPFCIIFIMNIINKKPNEKSTKGSRNMKKPLVNEGNNSDETSDNSDA